MPNFEQYLRLFLVLDSLAVGLDAACQAYTRVTPEHLEHLRAGVQKVLHRPNPG